MKNTLGLPWITKLINKSLSNVRIELYKHDPTISVPEEFIFGDIGIVEK